jgi:hypothetical protein
MAWVRAELGGEEHGVLSDVDAEGRRGPPTNGLDVVQGNTVLGKGSRSSAMHGLACNVNREVAMKPAQKPCTSWDGAVRAQPERWV